MELDVRALRQRRWWIDIIQFLSRSLVIPGVDVVFYTDASASGWGAKLGDTETAGHWSQEVKFPHSNELELLAVLYGLKSFCREFSGKRVRVRSDTSTTVACLNNCSSIQENLLDVTESIFDWAINHGVFLSASHIRGCKNLAADRLSRERNMDTEWSLKPVLFRALCLVFGCPHIDLFASRVNYQLPCYVQGDRIQVPLRLVHLQFHTMLVACLAMGAVLFRKGK